MRWEVWKSIFGQKAPAEHLIRGAAVYFRRGNLPELGLIVGDGDAVRVPLMRVSPSGRPITRRTYWRNRSQLYVARGGTSIFAASDEGEKINTAPSGALQEAGYG